MKKGWLRSIDPVLAYVFAGSRGGPTRIRMVQALMQRPLNPNMLAKNLGLDYKTVEYNLRVLTKHVLVTCTDPGTYGATYQPSKNLLAARDQFGQLAERLVPAASTTNLEKPSNTTPPRDMPELTK